MDRKKSSANTLKWQLDFSLHLKTTSEQSNNFIIVIDLDQIFRQAQKVHKSSDKLLISETTQSSQMVVESQDRVYFNTVQQMKMKANHFK